MGELFKLLGLGLFFVYNDGENAQKWRMSVAHNFVCGGWTDLSH